MNIILKNTTPSPIAIRDTGVIIAGYSSYVIDPQNHLLWTASSDTVDLIISGSIVVNDGEDDLNKRVGIALVQDNQIVLNEHYTLVCEDSVLVGNGAILYSNDEFNTTSNVPVFTDEEAEDDDPTGDPRGY